MRRWARITQFICWTSGAAFLTVSAGRYIETRWYQAVESNRLDRGRASPRAAPAPGRNRVDPPPTGSLVGRLVIPRLNLSAIVLEGSDSRTLSLGIGRVPNTANPGQPGNVVLGGHRDTFFRPLREIRVGDRVGLLTPSGRYSYVVEWTAVVEPSNLTPIRATSGRELTLVTCYPFRYLGSAPRRFVVRARQVAADGAAGVRAD